MLAAAAVGHESGSGLVDLLGNVNVLHTHLSGATAGRDMHRTGLTHTPAKRININFPFVPGDHRFRLNFRALNLQEHVDSHFFLLSFSAIIMASSSFFTAA